VHGLLVSPWFAAGAGFVVAAGAFMYAPHAELSFGGSNPLINTSPCASKCHHHTTIEQGAPPLAAGTGEGTLPTPSPSPSPGSAQAATAGMTFGYSVSWQSGGTFQMLLRVTSKKPIGSWQLAFVIQGARNVKVVDAQWQQSGTDGGTASGTALGSAYGPGETPRPSPSAGSGGDNGSYQRDVLYLFVDGDGTPTAPDQCVFNGTRCDFTLTASH
jgi:hypothetical protein